MEWERGQSGNPDGFKRYRRFLTVLERAIKADDGKLLRRACDQLLEQAADGNLQAIGMLRDTLDGKPAQSVDLGDNAQGLAVALVAYHPTLQLPAKAVSGQRIDSAGLGQEEGSSSLAS